MDGKAPLDGDKHDDGSANEPLPVRPPPARLSSAASSADMTTTDEQLYLPSLNFAATSVRSPSYQPNFIGIQCETMTPSSSSSSTLAGWRGSPKPSSVASYFGDEKKAPLSQSTSFDSLKDVSDWSVAVLSKHDDSDQHHGWRKHLFRLSPLTAVISQATGIVYLVYRALYTRRAEELSNKTFYSAWVFLCIELTLLLSTLVHALWIGFLWKGRTRPKLRVVGSRGVPTVDVFVCCCGEDVDVIMDTVRAACAIDWPTDRFRVLVLDDGGSDELRSEVELYSKHRAGNLVYQRRVKTPGVPHHAKAGNINAALARTTELTVGWVGAGEYTMSLDADMIPTPEIARALLGHLIMDDKVCLAGSPQLFYNIPEGDLLNQDLQTFFDNVEPLKDSAGVAWCTGSGFVMRRSVLDEIGGFPVGSLAEDVYCSSLMLGKGYRCAYVHEPLQCGLVPDSYAGHLKQRTRWTLGTLQTTNKLNWFLWGDEIRHMGFLQRFCGITYALSSLFTIAICASFVVFPFVLYSGGNLIPVTEASQIKLLLRLVFIHLVCGRVHEMIWSSPSSVMYSRREILAWSWMAPYHAGVLIRAALPSFLGGRSSGFKASGSISDGLNERDASRRAPLWRRFRFMLLDCSMWFHIAIFVGTFGAGLLACVRIFLKWSSDKYSTRTAAYQLLTRILWPPLAVLVIMSGLVVPIVYCLFPPSMPDRSDLLKKGKDGVARPDVDKIASASWKKQLGVEVIMDFIFLYTTALFVLTFVADFDAPSCVLLSTC